MTSDDQNPFAAPQTELAAPRPRPEIGDEPSELEDVRRRHLGHESSVQTIGWLMIFYGVGMAAIVLLAGNPLDVDLTVIVLGMAAILLLCVGVGLTRSSDLGRIFGVVLLGGGIVVAAGGFFVLTSADGMDRALGAAALAVLNPISLMIEAVFLYYLAGSKGSFVCSEQYQKIILQTPQIRPRPAPWISGLLIFLFTAVPAGAFALFPQ